MEFVIRIIIARKQIGIAMCVNDMWNNRAMDLSCAFDWSIRCHELVQRDDSEREKRTAAEAAATAASSLQIERKTISSDAKRADWQRIAKSIAINFFSSSSSLWNRVEKLPIIICSFWFVRFGIETNLMFSYSLLFLLQNRRELRKHQWCVWVWVWVNVCDVWHRKKIAFHRNGISHSIKKTNIIYWFQQLWSYCNHSSFFPGRL